MKMSSIFCDTHHKNQFSSKRIVTGLAFIFCTIAFFANLFFDKTIDAFIYETMAWIVLGGMTATAAEKFTKAELYDEQRENSWYYQHRRRRGID
jgi:hypothetical protein